VLIDDYIECVSLARGDLRKHFKAGVSPRRSTQNLPNLPEAKLDLWWAALSSEEQKMPRGWLDERLNADFPDYQVSRAKLRGLTGPRPAGRPKKLAED
jgi:hypothetical protein